jgi:hypothetical protein
MEREHQRRTANGGVLSAWVRGSARGEVENAALNLPAVTAILKAAAASDPATAAPAGSMVGRPLVAVEVLVPHLRAEQGRGGHRHVP